MLEKIFLIYFGASIARIMILSQTITDRIKNKLQAHADWYKEPKYAPLVEENTPEARRIYLKHKWEGETKEEQEKLFKKIKWLDRRESIEIIIHFIVLCIFVYCLKN